MSIGVKRAALALLSLSDKDRDWILQRLEPEQQARVGGYMDELAKNKKSLQALSFQEILELGKSQGVAAENESDPSVRVEEKLSQFSPHMLAQALEKGSTYTKWLVFSNEPLPNRTQLSKSLSEADERGMRRLKDECGEAEPWLKELALEWLVKEAGGQ